MHAVKIYVKWPITESFAQFSGSDDGRKNERKIFSVPNTPANVTASLAHSISGSSLKGLHYSQGEPQTDPRAGRVLPSGLSCKQETSETQYPRLKIKGGKDYFGSYS